MTDDDLDEKIAALEAETGLDLSGDEAQERDNVQIESPSSL
jgi:hypothetical protein